MNEQQSIDIDWARRRKYLEDILEKEVERINVALPIECPYIKITFIVAKPENE